MELLELSSHYPEAGQGVGVKTGCMTRSPTQFASPEMSTAESVILLAYEKRHGAERKFFHKLAAFFTWEERKPLHEDFKDVANLFVLVLRKK